jgi:hypothetical protein
LASTPGPKFDSIAKVLLPGRQVGQHQTHGACSRLAHRPINRGDALGHPMLIITMSIVVTDDDVFALIQSYKADPIG